MTAVAELLRSHMPADQSDWLDLAQTLGQGKLRERAARMDEENRFPFENYDGRRQSGLLGHYRLPDLDRITESKNCPPKSLTKGPYQLPLPANRQVPFVMFFE